MTFPRAVGTYDAYERRVIVEVKMDVAQMPPVIDRDPSNSHQISPGRTQ
jgi:hypothetical protein